MNRPIPLSTATLLIRNSISRSPLRRSFLLIAVATALACFALSPAVRAVSPPPDGGYPGFNTAEGDSALFSLTTGIGNTANGNAALFSNTTGSFNTANGVQALFSNTTGSSNTANGLGALASNTIGNDNTANGVDALTINTDGGANTASGFQALFSNTTGGNNTANGDNALYSNTTGFNNTANGFQALFSNTTGGNNTANGDNALGSNTTASDNTATGFEALLSNTTGSDNTANGFDALLHNASGSGNIALGVSAGANLTTGSHNIDIGNVGVAGESSHIRIGTPGTQTRAFIAGIHGVAVTGSAVVINTSGQLGVASSSERFKDAIEPMDKASEALLSLRPVTFRYKKNIDPKGAPQFGLVAEEVEKVNADLVVRDAEGKVFTVRYEAVNAMLLNEFLKEHRKVEEQEATITQLKSTVAQQQKGMEVFAATLKEQASQIQKVSAQLEVSKPAPQIVLNNQ
jgi:hypothetical protein